MQISKGRVLFDEPASDRSCASFQVPFLFGRGGGAVEEGKRERGLSPEFTNSVVVVGRLSSGQGDMLSLSSSEAGLHDGGTWWYGVARGSLASLSRIACGDSM